MSKKNYITGEWFIAYFLLGLVISALITIALIDIDNQRQIPEGYEYKRISNCQELDSLLDKQDSRDSGKIRILLDNCCTVINPSGIDPYEDIKVPTLKEGLEYSIIKGLDAKMWLCEYETTCEEWVEGLSEESIQSLRECERSGFYNCDRVWNEKCTKYERRLVKNV